MLFADRVGRRMRLNDLHVLLSVVEAGSMGKAAKSLGTSQPNVSRAIAHLERSIGFPLLDRTRSGIEPTPFGCALLNAGLAVFDDLRQGLQTIEALADPSQGHVRIGCNYFLASGFLPVVIQRLAAKYPRVNCELVVGDGRTILRKLQNRELDLLIAWKSAPYSDEEAAFKLLFEDKLAVLAGQSHPCVRRRRIRLQEIAMERWVLPPPESDFGAIVARMFSAAGVDLPRGGVTCFAPDIRMNFLETGQFLTVSAKSLFRYSRIRSGVQLLPIDMKSPRLPIGSMTLKGRTIGPAAQLLLREAVELVRKREQLQ